MKFQKNVSLKNYTTFKIGGKAKYFFTAKTKLSLVKAIKTAKQLNLPFFILGGGSNVLMPDKGFNGLVIKTGKPLASYVSKGLEWAVGIPGTIEGAVYENAGAFGKSMKDAVKSVEVFDSKTGKIKIFKNKDCQFGYRDSIFKKNPHLIILSVKLNTELSRSESEGKDEGKLRRRQTSSQKIKKYLEYRRETQPLNYPSAGSIFKNFTPHRNEISGAGPALKKLLKKFNSQDVIPAAYLIEKCNLKGKTIGRVQISKKHANFIINLDGASSKDVLELINLIKKEINKKFKIKLKEEIRIFK